MMAEDFLQELSADARNELWRLLQTVAVTPAVADEIRRSAGRWAAAIDAIDLGMHAPAPLSDLDLTADEWACVLHGASS